MQGGPTPARERSWNRAERRGCRAPPATLGKEQKYGDHSGNSPSSPRRRELERMGVKNFASSPPILTSTWSGAAPEAGGRISAEKARAVREQAGMDAVVIAADTVVALDGRCWASPRDELEAFKMLFTLSAAATKVYTGLTVPGEGAAPSARRPPIAFRELSEEEISCYIQTESPWTRRGLTASRGLGALLIEGNPRGLLQCQGPAA